MLTIEVPLFNPKTVRPRGEWGMLLGVAIVVLYLDYHFQQRGCSNTPHFISGCKEYELSRFRHGIVQLLIDRMIDVDRMQLTIVVEQGILQHHIRITLIRAHRGIAL